jgi:hypothetical protein
LNKSHGRSNLSTEEISLLRLLGTQNDANKSKEAGEFRLTQIFFNWFFKLSTEQHKFCDGVKGL